MALAANFQVTPLLLELSPGKRSGSLALTNQDSVAVTVQVQAVLWVQNEDGSFRYEPAPQLVISPKLLSIEPGSTLSLRVGYQGEFAAEERFYRVLIKEIPRNGAHASALSIALQLSVPVVARSLELQKAPLAIALESFEIRQGQLLLGVRNQGRTHARVGEMSFDFLDDKSASLGKADATGSDVLAGGRSFYKTTVDAGICAAIRFVRVQANVGKVVVEQEFPVAGQDCSSPPAASRVRPPDQEETRRPRQ